MFPCPLPYCPFLTVWSLWSRVRSQSRLRATYKHDHMSNRALPRHHEIRATLMPIRNVETLSYLGPARAPFPLFLSHSSVHCAIFQTFATPVPQSSTKEKEARTHSARTASKVRGNVAQANREGLGPPPEAPTLEARLRASAPKDPTPQVRRVQRVLVDECA